MSRTRRLDVPGEHLERIKEVRAIILQPYRVLAILQQVLLGLFLYTHLNEPVFDARLMWLVAFFCEFWLALAWLLEQMPKQFPIERETYPDKLTKSCKFSGGESDMPALDVFITTADLGAEEYLPMANSILSALAMEYPASKLCCYVSDENASRLSCEVLVEVSEFAKEWVPFCRKHGIQQPAPEVHLSRSLDMLKGQVNKFFIADRREVKVSTCFVSVLNYSVAVHQCRKVPECY